MARQQLAALGVTPEMLRTRIERGWLIRLHPGVYAVGHRQLRREGRALAAVLAVGSGAVLSHRDAAGLHRLRPANHRLHDVTVAARRRAPAGVRVHCTTVLHGADVTVVDRIPVTTVARTLVDLAAVVAPDHLAKALNEAERIHRVDVRWIEAALERTRHRPGRGHRTMRAVLDLHRARGLELTRSELEQRFARLVDTGGLPRPRFNAIVEAREVDAYWPAARLVVELDGWAFHSTRRAGERDRAKTNELQLLGYLVLRFTHRQVVHEPAGVLAALRRALGGAGRGPPDRVAEHADHERLRD